jgi:hypothetical protein
MTKVDKTTLPYSVALINGDYDLLPNLAKKKFD